MFSDYYYSIRAYDTPKDYKIPPDNELKDDLQHPELNSQCYNITAENSRPQHFLPFFTCIAQDISGLFLLACNNLTTNRVWDGLICGTCDFNDMTSDSFSKIKFYWHELGNYTNLLYLNETLFCAATSTNKLKIFSTKPAVLQKQKEQFCPFIYATEITNGNVKCMDKMVGENIFITGTSKGHISIYEFESSRLNTLRSFPYAHAGEITGISSSKFNPDMWVSTSADKNCLLWDKSQALPASALIENYKSRLTAVHWLTEYSVVVGDPIGNLLMVDTRMPNSILSQYRASKRAIDFICCNEKTKKFGVTGARNEIKIMKINEDGNFEETFKHTSGPHVIYSMCWDNTNDDDTFYAVGSEKYAEKICIK